MQAVGSAPVVLPTCNDHMHTQVTSLRHEYTHQAMNEHLCAYNMFRPKYTTWLKGLSSVDRTFWQDGYPHSTRTGGVAVDASRSFTAWVHKASLTRHHRRNTAVAIAGRLKCPLSCEDSHIGTTAVGLLLWSSGK